MEGQGQQRPREGLQARNAARDETRQDTTTSAPPATSELRHAQALPPPPLSLFSMFVSFVCIPLFLLPSYSLLLPYFLIHHRASPSSDCLLFSCLLPSSPFLLTQHTARSPVQRAITYYLVLAHITCYYYLRSHTTCHWPILRVANTCDHILLVTGPYYVLLLLSIRYYLFLAHITCYYYFRSHTTCYWPPSTLSSTLPSTRCFPIRQ